MVRILIQDGGQLIGIAFSENISRDDMNAINSQDAIIRDF
jgi:hypothetical protein